ncbi:MAG: type II toxin-antitoxin system RelE/ParE family toxin [Myxococcota bacterium]|nr:type II toxin-antitoxin system RelE/ParE family toxin [Myxococcota bacterium]
MKVQILDEAKQDLIEGFRFHESRSEGLGEYFLNSLFADIDSLQLYAGIHAVHFEYHRMLAKRFPFPIYYRVHQDLARVFAILDCRRDPAMHRERLS